MAELPEMLTIRFRNILILHCPLSFTTPFSGCLSFKDQNTSPSLLLLVHSPQHFQLNSHIRRVNTSTIGDISLPVSGCPLMSRQAVLSCPVSLPLLSVHSGIS